MKVMVLSAIRRPESSCFMLARLVAEMAEKHGVEVDFATPADAELPVNDGTLPFDHPATAAWAARVDEIHAHLWVSPEYHSGMTGGMKNMLDHLSKEPMRGDVVGLFALAGGAMAALNNMSVVARCLGRPRLRGGELQRGEAGARRSGPGPGGIVRGPGDRGRPTLPARGRRRPDRRSTHGVRSGRHE